MWNLDKINWKNVNFKSLIYIDDDDKRYEGAGVESLYNMMCYIQWPDDDNEDDY